MSLNRDCTVPLRFFLLFQVFPDKAQPDSHQLLQFLQHGPNPKGEEEPRCRESKADDQLVQVANETTLLMARGMYLHHRRGAQCGNLKGYSAAPM